MNKEVVNKLLDGLISGKELKSIQNKRKKEYITEGILYDLKDEYLNEGWELDREFKYKIRMRKSKPQDEIFEDQVWNTLANLGFELLNKDRNYRLPYSEDESLTQQVDVLAVDEQTMLLVKCKSAEKNTKGNFKEVIEAIGGRKVGILKTLKKMFPNSKHKVKFVLATNNYYLSKPDIERLENFDIIHFDEEIIGYYQDLTKQLGLSARFQLLGNLFEGQTIPELENQIPAIEGKMGSHTYYSFSIEPDKLLKLGYVLHRNKANKKLMPTYQRMIKRARLKSVQEFIDCGGYFPNSLIINIEAKRKLKFERANTQVKNAISNIGVLHLPKKYRSAFIIDGQHRLYGYANSKYKSNNSIPVVAFVNLNRSEQVKLFMDINEKQKAVPKNLRNTLNANLLWNSESLIQQFKALRLQIAQDLGEDKDSPLYERIIIGENKKTSRMCITIDAVATSLYRSDFFGKISKNVIIEDGTFYNGDLDSTYNKIVPYLKSCFNYLKNNLSEEIWEKGEEGIVLINKGVYAIIMVISDIINHLSENKYINPKSDAKDKLFEETKTYLDPIIHFFKNITDEQVLELKSRYGSGGDTKYWRTLELVVQETHASFKPSGLEDYLKKEAKEFNEKSYKLIRDLEQFFNSEFKEKLKSKFDKSWWKKGVPPDVYEKAELLASKKNREIEDEEDEVTPWECLNLIDYRKIALKNWRDLYEKNFTKPGEEKISGGKDAKTKWLVKLERIRNENFHSYSVTEEEFAFLTELHEWLIQRTIRNKFQIETINMA